MLTYIALGTNLGRRRQNLSRARNLLSEHVRIIKTSAIYETEPWGVTDQPKFLNQVLEGQTDLDAPALLQFVKLIERKMGRKPSVRYGPRLIDLDILLLGDLQLDTPGLVIPHPRMAERAFVLVPLAEIAPFLVIPGTDKTAVETLAVLDVSGIHKVKEIA